MVLTYPLSISSHADRACWLPVTRSTTAMQSRAAVFWIIFAVVALHLTGTTASVAHASVLPDSKDGHSLHFGAPPSGAPGSRNNPVTIPNGLRFALAPYYNASDSGLQSVYMIYHVNADNFAIASAAFVQFTVSVEAACAPRQRLLVGMYDFPDNSTVSDTTWRRVFEGITSEVNGFPVNTLYVVLGLNDIEGCVQTPFVLSTQDNPPPFVIFQSPSSFQSLITTNDVINVTWKQRPGNTITTAELSIIAYSSGVRYIQTIYVEVTKGSVSFPILKTIFGEVQFYMQYTPLHTNTTFAAFGPSLQAVSPPVVSVTGRLVVLSVTCTDRS